MPIQPRTRQLFTLMIWIGSVGLIILIGAAYGWTVIDRRFMLLAILLGLPPAALGYVAIGLMVTALDDRRLRRGHNVYQEDEYVDNAGFIHLNATSARINKGSENVSDLLSDAGKVVGAITSNPDDSTNDD